MKAVSHNYPKRNDTSRALTGNNMLIIAVKSGVIPILLEPMMRS